MHVVECPKTQLEPINIYCILYTLMHVYCEILLQMKTSVYSDMCVLGLLTTFIYQQKYLFTSFAFSDLDTCSLHVCIYTCCSCSNLSPREEVLTKARLILVWVENPCIIKCAPDRQTNMLLFCRGTGFHQALIAHRKTRHA